MGAGRQGEVADRAAKVSSCPLTLHTRQKRVSGETHLVAGAAQLAAEHQAGLLQQQVGITAAVGFLQAGLCLLQEELEANKPVRAGAAGTS